MAIELHRPRNVRLAIVEPRGRRRRSDQVRAELVDIAARGLVVGVGVGVLLRSADIGAVSLTVVGILALGAALVSWSR